MHKLLFIGFLAFFCACQQTEQPKITNSNLSDAAKTAIPRKPTKEKKAPDITTMSPEQARRHLAKEELKAWERKYKDSLPEYANIPSLPYAKVILYELNGSAENGGAIATFYIRKEKQITLSKADIKELISIINNPNNFDESAYACFDPRHGFVFYDANNIPTEYFSICLDCNNIYAAPNLLSEKIADHKQGGGAGFSKPARKRLKKLFKKLGMPYTGYDLDMDTEEDFYNQLIHEGVSPKEARERAKDRPRN